MEQDRKPRNKPVHLMSITLPQRRQEYAMEKRQPLQSVVLGKLDSYMHKNEIRALPNAIHNINSKWIKDLHVRPEAIKLRGKHWQNTR